MRTPMGNGDGGGARYRLTSMAEDFLALRARVAELEARVAELETTAAAARAECERLQAVVAQARESLTWYSHDGLQKALNALDAGEG